MVWYKCGHKALYYTVDPHISELHGTSSNYVVNLFEAHQEHADKWGLDIARVYCIRSESGSVYGDSVGGVCGDGTNFAPSIVEQVWEW